MSSTALKCSFLLEFTRISDRIATNVIKRGRVMKTCKKTMVRLVALLAVGLACVLAYCGLGNAGVNSRIVAYAEDSVVSVTTKEGLAEIADNPAGSYRLDADIDMSGVNWVPFTFSGKLDGNGHAILNLSYSVTGSESDTSYDGNYKKYDTYFGGLFSIVREGASISNLKLININASLESDVPVFLGSVAGFLDGGIIDGCTISGQLQLATTAKMFGVGGIAGYGRGSITNTDSTMTLVCIDNDVKDKDEQFLGGAYATGYIDMDNCNVTVYGYDSDHGYVHNGGLTGMYMFYPYGQKYSGKITNCNVNGFISFFEDNTDRRAYCKAYYGELLSTSLVIDGCTESFERREVYDYSKNLLPDSCDNAITPLDKAPGERYSKKVTESTYTEYGYTTYTCNSCGYEYTDNYTLLASDLKRIKEEQEKSTKESLSLSDDTSAVRTDNASSGDWIGSDSKGMGVLVIILAVAVLIIVIFIAVYLVNQRRRRMRNRYKKRKSGRKK